MNISKDDITKDFEDIDVLISKKIMKIMMTIRQLWKNKINISGSYIIYNCEQELMFIIGHEKLQLP